MSATVESGQPSRAALPGGRTIVLLAGDLLAVLLFAILGRNTHGEATGLEAARAVLGTAAPFLGGWLFASVALRRYTFVPDTPAGAARRGMGTWLVAFPVAVAFRAAALARWSPLSFYIVAFLVPLLLLIAWRSTFALFERASRRSRSNEASKTNEASS